MFKIILSAFLLLVCMMANAGTLITKDGRMSIAVDSQKVMVRTPGSDDIFACKFIRSAPGNSSPSYDAWTGYFYQCGNNLIISIKNYAQRKQQDEVFVFEGTKAMYSGQLSSKFK